MSQELVTQVIEDVTAEYHPSRSIDEIDEDKRWELGRRLYEVGHKIGAIVVKRDITLSPNELLVKNLVSKSELDGRPFTIPGPLYGRHNEDTPDETEYLNPNGVAFWRVYDRAPSGPNSK